MKSVGPVYWVWPSAPWIVIRMPSWPARVIDCPLGAPVNGAIPVWCRFRFDATRTPTMISAISAAAMPAIHTGGPIRAGRFSASAARTRADSAGLGTPLIASNSRLISRRKLSRVMSGHLLEGQVGTETPRGPIDSRLGGRRRHAQSARDLVQRQVEGGEEGERKAIIRAQSCHCSSHVT